MSITIICDICAIVIPDEHHRESIITARFGGWGPGAVYTDTDLHGHEIAPEHKYQKSVGHLCGKCEQIYIEVRRDAFTEIVAIFQSIKGRIQQRYNDNSKATGE